VNDIKNEEFLNKVLHGDCLDRIPQIEDKSIDMILCDLPYGTTRNKWDSIIPLDELWEQYNRVIKDNGVICLTSAEPFTSMLVTSNLKMFRYDIIWEKQKGSDPLNANRKPLRSHENILVFYKKLPVYNPQFECGEPYMGRKDKSVKSSNFNTADQVKGEGSSSGKRYPKTVIRFSNEGMNSKNLHPTQKPVKLFEWLTKTYTNEGETVLDNCLGSGTTAVACINTNRNFIGIEKEWNYCEIANKRIEEARQLKV
jgi:site-specific DNA-methyltransferase (adenine-specific)